MRKCLWRAFFVPGPGLRAVTYPILFNPQMGLGFRHHGYPWFTEEETEGKRHAQGHPSKGVQSQGSDLCCPESAFLTMTPSRLSQELLAAY